MKNQLLWFRISVVLVLFGLSFGGCNKNETSPTGNSEDIQELLEGSFDTLTTFPAPVSLTYIRKDGTTSTADVIPGQIIILIENTNSSDTVTQLFLRNAGTVVAQIPKVGLFVVRTNPNTISTFLSAMYQSSIVIDALPNSFITGYGSANGVNNNSIKINTDPNSLIQTIDLSATFGCGTMTHKDAVGAIARDSNISVQINDVTTSNANSLNAGTNQLKVLMKLFTLLSSSWLNNSPIIINISLGPKPDNLDQFRDFYRTLARPLHIASLAFPSLLNNALIIVSGSDKSINQTGTFNELQNEFSGSPIWNSLYFGESQEGAAGCGIGYAMIGTANVLNAPGCNVRIPNSSCTENGNSLSTPAIANLVAKAFLACNQSISLNVIARKLWEFQKNNNGRLPTVAELLSLSCTYTISPSSQSFDSSGGSGAISITAGSGCAWTATSSSNWISITSGSSGNGNGTVNYSVQVNTNSTQRVGTITIAGKNCSVTQAGSSSGGVIQFDGSYTGSYSGTATTSYGTESVSGTVTLTVSNGTIIVTSPGSGSGTVSASGSTSFSGSGGVSGASYSFSGTFAVASGTASASGEWAASFSGGTGAGTWGVTRH
ncbi:MAG: hypothetical protein A2V66_13795 [Ignavibacteria bacterium RBG_13_36_8]|nr:MAG: hypothetical protein A2V66_13795 [Ignavibacteria bacterium RBG_13_36_8]